MKSQDLINIVDDLRVWKRGGERAPHKPLLILYALGRIAREGDRLTPYEELEEDLTSLPWVLN